VRVWPLNQARLRRFQCCPDLSREHFSDFFHYRFSLLGRLVLDEHSRRCESKFYPRGPPSGHDGEHK